MPAQPIAASEAATKKDQSVSRSFMISPLRVSWPPAIGVPGRQELIPFLIAFESTYG